MLIKINHDSFKGQAFYHNQCMTKYLVGVKQESEVNDNSSSDIEAAFSQLVNDISEDLLKSKKAFLLSSLLDKMFSYLPEYVPKDLTTRKLQRKLESHYGESIVIQSQQGQGKSNIIMSSSITLGDAIKAASNLKAELKWSQENQLNRSYSKQMDDQLLHAVASIIRKDIDNVKIFGRSLPSINGSNIRTLITVDARFFCLVG